MSRYASFAFCAALACLACTHAVHAQIIAADSYTIPPYTTGILSGQAVSGTGLTGTWAQDGGLTQSLYVVSSGLIGRENNDGANAGDYANFTGGGFTLTSGQLFMSYDIDSTSALTSSRMDINVGSDLQGAALGGIGSGGNYGFVTNNVGSSVLVDTGIASVGAHHIVGVFDFTNDQIAIFVDPTASSYYNTNGTNDANATAAWVPPASATFTSYEYVDTSVIRQRSPTRCSH